MYDNIPFLFQGMQSQRAAMRAAFRELDVSDPASGDHFFEQYTPGNAMNQIDRPLERFHDYELVLLILSSDDPQKYNQIHKGTPFYFLGWLAFELRNYEAAIFYMSAALSEDKRKSNGQPFNTWVQNPAGQFMSLEQDNQPS